MEHDVSLHVADVRKPPLATLCAMFDGAVATAPDRVALRHFDVALTDHEMARAVAALAKHLVPLGLRVQRYRARDDDFVDHTPRYQLGANEGSASISVQAGST